MRALMRDLAQRISVTWQDALRQSVDIGPLAKHREPAFVHKEAQRALAFCANLKGPVT